MLKDEAFQEYGEALDKCSREFREAKENAKATLNVNLKAIRDELHNELRAVRDIQQRRGR